MSSADNAEVTRARPVSTQSIQVYEDDRQFAAEREKISSDGRPRRYHHEHRRGPGGHDILRSVHLPLTDSGSRRHDQSDGWDHTTQSVPCTTAHLVAAPLAGLSLHSPPRQTEAPHNHDNYVTTPSRPHFFQSRQTHIEENLSIAQERYAPVRRPLHLYSASQVNQQSQRIRPPLTPLRHLSSERPTAPISSPFFSRATIELRAEPVRRKPLYGNSAPSPSSPSHHAATYTLPNMPNHATQPGRVQPRTLNGLSFIDSPHGPDVRRPLHQSPAYPAHPGENHAYPQLTVRRTLRNAEGSVRRKQPQLRATNVAPLGPASQAIRNRVTLPPSGVLGRSAASNQERTLSNLPGARGVSSYGARPRQYLSSSDNVAARSLYSAAGGRRSVMR